MRTLRKLREKFYLWLSWHLPKELCTRAFCRVVGYATTGKYGNTILPELTVDEALNRWIKQK